MKLKADGILARHTSDDDRAGPCGVWNGRAQQVGLSGDTNAHSFAMKHGAMNGHSKTAFRSRRRAADQRRIGSA